MRYIDLSYHGSYYNLSSEEYLKKSESNIEYSTYLKKKYSISFIFHSGYNHIIERKGISYRFIKKKLNSKILVPLKLSRDIGKSKPDVILVHSILYIHFASFLRLFIPKKTIILIQNHGEIPPNSYIKKRLMHYCDKWIDGYLFTSKKMGHMWTENRLIKSSDKVFEVMEGSTSFKLKDKLYCRKQIGISMTKPVFLWVGRLNSNKDPLCVLKALYKFKNQGNDFEFYMFYHTTELLKDIQEFLVHNDLQKNVFLKGKIEHSELEKWYNASDYYISASHKEGSGYALCEAMACGSIPIVSQIPSFEYMTKDGYVGLLFEKGNSTALFECLNKTIDLDMENQRKRVNRIFQERLSFEAIAKGVESVIQKVLAKK